MQNAETWVVDLRIRDGREGSTGEYVTAEVLLSVNIQALATQLGHKAAKSKRGRASANHGAIRARITRVKP